MITAQAVVAPQMSNVGRTAKATIKASARLFQFFSDQVYTKKYVAIWRELVANGVDSHVAAGTTDKAVIITLPTTFTPYAKVRDFGTGMDHVFLVGDPENGIESKFMAFTDASTKENSNDFIGGFGIGSKAPLAYTEQFAIHSFQNGVQRIYSVFKDDEGCPAIAFLSENPTIEPNGVEISFPVEQTDITNFKEAALDCLRYFTPTPVLKNCSEQITPPEYTVRSKEWGFRKGETTSQIVQGGVAYPINLEAMPLKLHEILGFGIDFYVPIGTVNVALSREGLSYDDNTIAAISALCDTVKPDIQKHINKMFDGYATRWEALRAYFDAVYGRSQSSRLIEQLAEYKGQKLTRHIDPVMKDKVFAAFISDSRWGKHGHNTWTASRANPQVMAWNSSIAPKDIDYILIDDAPDKPTLRARNFLENMCNINDGVMLVKKRPDREEVVDGKTTKWINDLDWDKWIEEMGNPPVVRLSTIEPATLARNGGSLRRPEKIRGYTAPRVTSKFVDELPAGGGYYIEMENFAVKGISEQERRALDTQGKPLLYFNKGDFEKVKNNPEWKSAKSRVDEQIAAYKKAHPNRALADAFYKLTTTYSYHTRNTDHSRLLELIKTSGFNCPKRGPISQYKKLYEKAAPDITTQDAALRELIKVDSTKQLAMLNLIMQVARDKYPELMLVLRKHFVSNDMMPVYNKLVG